MNRNKTNRLNFTDKRLWIIGSVAVLVLCVVVLVIVSSPVVGKGVQEVSGSFLESLFGRGRQVSPNPNATEDDAPYTAEEIAAVLERNTGITARQQELIDAALSLVGRINYFWGGKSTVNGWDDAWNQPAVVTSSGSESTGTTKPYGLDCSGFTYWAYNQVKGLSQHMNDDLGQGTWKQWDTSKAIEWKNLRPGDLVFQYAYPTNLGNHVGICIGYDEKSRPVFVHCTAKYDNVVVTNAGEFFSLARRHPLMGR